MAAKATAIHCDQWCSEGGGLKCSFSLDLPRGYRGKTEVRELRHR